MHVSLPRRYHRVGLSLQYLLWFCFGLLAVAPWQMLRGEDVTEKTRVETPENDWSSEPDPTPKSAKARASSKKSRPKRQNSIAPLTIRSQSDPSQMGQPASGPSASGPYNLTPLNSGPFSDAPPSDGSFLDDERLTGRSGKAYGAQFRASFLTGPAVGRQHDIIPIEMMPYAFHDNSLIFGDIRGFASTNPSGGGFGMNVGGGARFYIPKFDRILGVNAYYDYDNSSGALFREIGFGAESLGALYDVRANAYLPTGQSSSLISLNNINGTQVFFGHNLLVNQAKVVANALRGFDAEIGVPLPGRIALRHDVRVFGGGYSFEGDQIGQFAGWRVRGQGNVTPNIQLNLLVSNDPQFHTNVVFGATWVFGGYKSSEDGPKTQYERMTTPVYRQYNMVVGLTTQVLTGVTVINPTTGTPYFFEHVSDNASHPVATPQDNGTVEHPWLTLADAQAVASANDIIFVHGNSSYTGDAVTLQQNIRVLGESTGVEHLVNTNAGPLLLPHPTAAPAVAPIFANSPTDGVTLANNSEFSGFQITGANGFGIIGTGVSNVTLREDTVTNSTNSGVFLNATSGTILMQGDVINDPTTTSATTFLITGTTGTIIFTQDPLSDLRTATGAVELAPGIVNNVVGTGGSALVVQNTAAGSVVNFTGSTVNDTTGNGILITQNAGVVTLGDANVTNGLGIGIDILNNVGTVFGNGTYNIKNSTGDAIVVQGTAAGGNVFFTDPGTSGTGANPAGINITNRNARGIFIEGNAGNTTFLTPVSIAALGTLPLAAIDYQGNSGNAIFDNTISINGGGVGIQIGNALGVPPANTGAFTVNANTTITGTTGIGIDITNDQSTVTFNGAAANVLLINQRGNIGIQILADQGTVNFGGTTTINNQNLATVPAVDIRRNNVTNASVTFNTLNIEGAQGPTAAPFGGIGLNIGGVAAADANAASVTINTLNIGDVTPSNRGTALFVDQEGTNTGTTLRGLIIGSGVINANTGAAIDIENTTMRTIFTSVSSTASPTNGVTLINDQSFTALPNNVTAPLLNDYMFEILGNPAAVLRNGGLIQLATGDGIFISQTNANLFQTGDVSLNQVTLTANNQGIVANGLLQFNMTNSEVNATVHNGLVGTDIPLVNIFTSYFNLNGSVLADNSIHLTANTTLLTTNRTAGAYDWNIENNNTTSAGLAAGFFGAVGAGNIVQVDSGGQTLKVQTTPTITTVTPLVFNFVNNTILMQAGPLPVAGAVVSAQIAGVAVDWTGFQSGSINQNTFTMLGFDQGIQIVNTDPTYLTNYFILGNSITANNGGNIGIFVNDFGPTILNIGTLLSNGKNIQNTFTFNTPAQINGGVNTADIGMEFSVLNSTTTASLISLTDNVITMTGAAPDQGLLFTLLQGASPGQTTVNLSNNTISVSDLPNAPFPGQGIDFQTILGTINLEGALSNNVTINGTNTIPNAAGVTTADWVILPANPATRTGQFLVNGLTVR